MDQGRGHDAEEAGRDGGRRHVARISATSPPLQQPRDGGEGRDRQGSAGNRGSVIGAPPVPVGISPEASTSDRKARAATIPAAIRAGARTPASRRDQGPEPIPGPGAGPDVGRSCGRRGSSGGRDPDRDATGPAVGLQDDLGVEASSRRLSGTSTSIGRSVASIVSKGRPS